MSKTANNKMTQAQFNSSISRARTLLIDRWPFIGFLALHLRPKMDESIPTAAVTIDGTMLVNPEFFASLPQDEQTGLLAHEVLHPALACWARQGERNDLVEINGGQVVSLWNLAHDLSFNTLIQDYGQRTRLLKLPEGAAVDRKYENMSAEEIYDLLLAEAKKNGPSKCGGGKGGAGAGKLNIDSSIGDDLVGKGSESQDGQKAERGDPVARRKLETEWKVNVCAAAQAQEKASGRGSLPAWLQRIIDDIVEPKLDWREELSRWVGENGPRNDYSFRRPSRRSCGVDTYLPSLVKHGIADDVTVLLDTSGSMGSRRIGECLGEIQGICEDLGATVRVIVVDADIHADLEIESVVDALDEIKGGGGSDFRPAFNRLEKESYDGCVVAFTDGDIAVPETCPPTLKGTLWAIGSNDRDPTGGRWGEVVRMVE